MKTIIKIIYIAFCLVFAVIIALGMYTSFASSNYTALLSNAIAKAKETENYQDADYDDIVRCFSIFSTPLEDEPDVLYAEENGKNITFMYESVNQHNASYTVDGETKTISRVENVYLFVMLNPEFYCKTLSDKTNPSALRFYGTNGSHFDYLFNLNENCNNGTYKATPTTERESVLYGNRSLLDTYREEFGLIFVPITETTIGFIEEELNGDIAGYNIIDNTGTTTVYKNKEYVEFAFDYPSTAGTFYSDLADFVKYYNIYTDSQKGVGDYTDEEKAAAKNYIEAFTEDPSSQIPDFYSKYIQGCPREAVYTGVDMVMKTIGITALFVVVAFLFYVLLFHFKSIKKFIRKLTKKEEPERKAPVRRSQTNVVISKSKVKRAPAQDQVKRAPVEEVKAEEAPVEEVKTEEAPVEEVKTEEAPEEVKTEEAPEEEKTEEAPEEVKTEEAPEEVKTEEAPEEVKTEE